jgi:peptidoglycan-associated lipoprotein
MNVLSKKLSVLLAAAACLLAGCPKAPVRPDPSATVLGPQSGGPNIVQPTALDLTTGPTDLQARPEGNIIDDGRTIRGLLQPVYFDFDRTDIKPSERAKLQAAKTYLDQNPGTRLLLEGYADWRGTAEYNQALGDRRANSAKRFLQTLGIPADRLESNSKGSLEASKNADDATAAKDRRAEVVIIKANPTATPL